MALSADKVAAKVKDYMSKNGLSSMAVPWSDFYTLVERGAIRSAFQADLAVALKNESILIAYGQAVVSIAKDYAPPNLKHSFK